MNRIRSAWPDFMLPVAVLTSLFQLISLIIFMYHLIGLIKLGSDMQGLTHCLLCVNWIISTEFVEIIFLDGYRFSIFGLHLSLKFNFSICFVPQSILLIGFHFFTFLLNFLISFSFLSVSIFIHANSTPSCVPSTSKGFPHLQGHVEFWKGPQLFKRKIHYKTSRKFNYKQKVETDAELIACDI